MCTRRIYYLFGVMTRSYSINQSINYTHITVLMDVSTHLIHFLRQEFNISQYNHSSIYMIYMQFNFDEKQKQICAGSTTHTYNGSYTYVYVSLAH